MHSLKELDTYIVDLWNDINAELRITEEALWEMCRDFEAEGIVVGDNAAVSAKSIGPFKVATTLNVDQMEVLEFFLESIIPTLLINKAGIPFEEVYALYLCPIAKLAIKFITKTVIVKNFADWEILLFIINENKQKRFPKTSDIMNNFLHYTNEEISDSIERLKTTKTISGTTLALVFEHSDNGIESKV